MIVMFSRLPMSRHLIGLLSVSPFWSVSAHGML